MHSFDQKKIYLTGRDSLYLMTYLTSSVHDTHGCRVDSIIL